MSRRRAVSASSVRQRTDPLGNSTSYQYDSVGNLTQKTTPNNTTINYTYDANNRLIEKTTPEGTTSYQYDQNNNLIAAANHLTTIATSNGSYSFTYDAAGRRTKLSYPSNTRTRASYSYDKNNNLTNIKQASATNGTIADTPYSYDTVNNRITKQAITYSYDPLYQLISASGTTPESYSYDALGNRQGSYQHNAANQTLSSPQGNYSYDQNGNQTSRGTWTQTWNSDNQLITTTNGTVTVTFKYDPFGRRIEKTTTNPGGSTTYRYLYDGPNIIQEIKTTATATETTNYLHGPNIDEPLGMERNNQNYYFHQDGLGSIIAITDASGQKVQSYSYDSFGNPTQTTAFRNSFQFTGREWDKETGLYYYRARYYDPIEGRFISKDPIGFAGGINQYAYVQNNPVNFIDPSGLKKYGEGSLCEALAIMAELEKKAGGRKQFVRQLMPNYPIHRGTEEDIFKNTLYNYTTQKNGSKQRMGYTEGGEDFLGPDSKTPYDINYVAIGYVAQTKSGFVGQNLAELLAHLTSGALVDPDSEELAGNINGWSLGVMAGRLGSISALHNTLCKKSTCSAK